MSETKQTRVAAVVDDMFFASKIKEAAKLAQVDLEIIKTHDGIEEYLTTFLPTLIIVDLNSKKINVLDLITNLKASDILKHIRTLGYLPHVQQSLKDEAVKAGYDVVMPRSRFVRELSEILSSNNCPN